MTDDRPLFDVFLAHNSQDKPQVRAIAEKLKNRGLRPWLDEEQIHPGESFTSAIEKAIHNVKAVAIFIGSKDIGRWQAFEIQSLINESIKAQLTIIPVILPGVENLENLPLVLKSLKFVNFTGGNHDSKAIDNLVRAINKREPYIELIHQTKQFDVFLCYQNTDRFEVAQIAKQLKKHQISYYPNEWELNTYTSWQDVLTQPINEINSLAVFIGNNGEPWEDEEVENFIWEFIENKHPVVPVILPSTLQEPKFPKYLKRKQVVDFRQRETEVVDFRQRETDPILQLIHLISKGDRKKGNLHG
ncbi:tetratricopeptide TPR_2 repeat protein (plasmid) [Calothrix sp. NIES-4101]|nr:tetratricopeptide TPR_2 repeat protein [Calothrix sp. NIES-4101]